MADIPPGAQRQDTPKASRLSLPSSPIPTAASLSPKFITTAIPITTTASAASAAAHLTYTPEGGTVVLLCRGQRDSGDGGPVYGVGPPSSPALLAWLRGADRFSSSRKAVRSVGLDTTVHSSNGKRRPGQLSRQGPEVSRWLLFEAAKKPAESSGRARTS